MMVLDGSMKIVKMNNAFLSLFELEQAPPFGSRLSDIPHPFWQGADIRKELSSIVINNQELKHRKFHFQTRSGESKVTTIDSRIIEGKAGTGRKVFLLIEDVTPL
jgi:PAS domain-containing protein